MGISNIFADISWALRSIFAYKRRSLATGAGLILGAAILSSIFFYGGMLNVIAIQDIIASPEADIIFNPLGKGSVTNTTIISENIEAHKEVANSIFQYTHANQMYSQEGEIFPIVFPQDFNYSLLEPWINEEQIYTPVIIPDNELKNQQLEAITISRGTGDLSGAGCLLNVWYFRHLNIRLNDIINLNLSIVQYQTKNATYVPVVIASTLLSLEVKGFFANSEVYSSSNIIMAEHNVDSEIIDLMRNNSMFRWLTKLDYSKLPVNSAKNLQTAIQSLIFRIEQENNGAIRGDDLVSYKLVIMQFQSVIMQIVNAVLYIPAIILSLILVNFGTELALQERKYEIAVLKAQGASPKQIRKAIMTEVLIIALIGETIGITLGVFGAATVVSSYSFLSLDFARFGVALSSLRITPFAIIIPVLITLGIVLIQSIKKTNAFLAQEVALSKYIERKKIGWFKRIYGDVIFFIIGLVGVALNVTKDLNPTISYGFWPSFIQFIAPITLWYGSAGVVSRISTKVPEILDKYIIKLFKDIGILFKGSLARRHQNFPRVTVMLTLAISLSFLAAIQGETSLKSIELQADYAVGGDMILEISTTSLILNINNFTGLENKIDHVIPLYSASLMASSESIIFYGANLEEYGNYARWSRNAFVQTRDWKKALSELSEKPTDTFAINKAGARILGTKFDPTIHFTLPYDAYSFTAKAILTFDHAPGGVGATQQPVALVDKEFLLTHAPNDTTIVAAIIILKQGVDAEEENLAYHFTANYSFVTEAWTYEEVYKEVKQAQARYFGIPGLLTIDYLVAIITSIIGIFIFMFTIINRRKQEFAILIAEGAAPTQIIKLVFSEILSTALFATIFGSLIGFLLGYQFNGFFALFDTTNMDRALAFPAITLLVSVIGSFVAIIGAALLPAIAATKVRVVEEMRVL